MWYPSRLGEGIVAIHDRVGGFLTVFVPEVQRRFGGQHKRILLVSHAATVVVLARELVGDRDLLFRVGCCSLSVLDRKVAPASEGESPPPTVVGGWAARLLGGGDHLKDGLLRAWGFEDAVIADGGEVRFLSSCSVAFGLHTLTSDYPQVVNETGQPGTENEKDEPVGSQIVQFSRI
jgi:transcription factor C subunit 7